MINGTKVFEAPILTVEPCASNPFELQFGVEQDYDDTNSSSPEIVRSEKLRVIAVIKGVSDSP